MSEREIVRDIKEKLCYFTLDWEGDMQRSHTTELDKQYTTDKGEVITISKYYAMNSAYVGLLKHLLTNFRKDNERFRAPEVLLDRAMVGLESSGLDEWIYNAIRRIDAGVRDQYWSNIVLAGGSTLFPGMPARLIRDLTRRCERYGLGLPNINIIDHSDRLYASWIGGSIVASLSDVNQDHWISAAEYNEYGPTIVNRKVLC